MRLKLWELSLLPPAQLREALQKWPKFGQIAEDRQNNLEQKIRELHNRLRELALHRAKEYGLNLPPERVDDFVNKYTHRHLEEEKKLWDETQPRRDKADQDIKAEMIEEFGGTTDVQPSPP